MKFIALVSCVFVVAFIGQTLAQEYRRPAQPNRYRYRRPHGRFERNPCGSNDLGDYRGGCDISVPVIVMPKGRPIMERVLDWFNCGTEWCRPSEPETLTTEEPPTSSEEPPPEEDIPSSPTSPPAESSPSAYYPPTSEAPTSPSDEDIPIDTPSDGPPADDPYWN